MCEYGQYTVPKVEELVDFKVGQPAPGMLPLDKIRKAATAKLAEENPLLLQYGNIPGYPAFRKDLAEFLTRAYSTPVDSEHLFISPGVTGAIAFYLGIACVRGDIVFSEEPTYFLAKCIFNDFGLNLHQIPMDKDGLDVDALEKKLRGGCVPKMIYLVPTAHNPTGRTLSVERRAKLVDLADEFNFTIFADEVYQLLTFPHVEAPPPMMAFDKGRGRVLAAGSFSKILAPALRLGWLWAAPKLLEPLKASGQMDSSGGFSPIIQGVVHKCVTEGLLAEHVAWSRGELWRRAEGLMAALDKHLPAGCSYEVPKGGYFVLVQCPEGTDTVALNELARSKHQVGFLPGAGFGQSMKHYLRLSFSYYNAGDLVTGVVRLSAAITDHLSQSGPSPKKQKV